MLNLWNTPICLFKNNSLSLSRNNSLNISRPEKQLLLYFQYISQSKINKKNPQPKIDIFETNSKT